MQNRNAPQSVPPRVGFTLVETLIVIGIVGLLVATLVIAIGPSLESARINATRTTIAQIDAAIQARVEAIAKLDVSVEAKKLAALNSSIDVREAEFFIRKNLYRQALPQRAIDLLGIDHTDDDGGDDDSEIASTAWLAGADSSFGTNDDATPGEIFFRAMTQESSVRVLPRLTGGRGGKSYAVPVLNVDDINPKHVRDNDGDGLPDEFIDEWNQPLSFYNFPTLLIRPGGGTTAVDTTNASVLIAGLPTDTSANGPLQTDPLDSTKLSSNQFTALTSITVAASPTANHTIEPFTEADYHTPNTYYVPLLVSSGPDQTMALGTAMSDGDDFRLCGVNGTLDELTDNITNRQQ